jgi:hypothetical protein
MPPARCTCSMWNFVEFGATLHRQGTRRERASMSGRAKSISPSWAAARMCRIVLVDPPMAMSRAMAFSNAALVAMRRGSTDSSSCS